MKKVAFKWVKVWVKLKDCQCNACGNFPFPLLYFWVSFLLKDVSPVMHKDHRVDLLVILDVVFIPKCIVVLE